jgi:hypothetical protein
MKPFLVVLALCFAVNAKTLTNYGANNHFGNCISVSGNTMVISELNQGIAYVYEQTTSGWIGVASLMPTTGGNITSVAVSGSTMVAGSTLSNVYVFEMPEGGWRGTVVQSAILTASDQVTGNQFGYSVAINGSTVVVGAPTGGSGGQGEAYLYVKPVNGWASTTETSILSPSDGQHGINFGWRVAVSGVQAVVTAPQGGGTLNQSFGDLYVFQEPISGWNGPLTETAQLTDGDHVMGAQLGSSVAINGTTVIAGEPGTPQAHVVIYERIGKTWASTSTPNAVLTESTESSGLGFGQAVAISPSAIIVGDPEASNPNWHRDGAVFYYVMPQSGWISATQTAKVTPSGNNTGYTVALGRTGKLIVGAPDTLMGGNQYQGAVFIVAP